MVSWSWRAPTRDSSRSLPPTWTPVPPSECDGVPGIVRVNTGTLPDAAKGVSYCLRLPPEYHHGRSYPLVVGFSILPAISGAFLAMALTMSVLDIFTMLGLIMMLGLVAKNGILLVDFASQAKKEGMTTIESLVAAGRTRLRPILMTTLSMSIGFLPIALAKGAGSEWKNGLAWALIGGLTSSMVLTLLIVPVVFQFIEGLREFFGKAGKALGIKKEEDEGDDWNNDIPEPLVSQQFETH